MSVTIVKVGGSLFDMPDLAKRLRDFLDTFSSRQALVVAGGGPPVDVIREYDRVHRLGEEASHALALRVLSLNAWFLSALLGGTMPVIHPFRAGDWHGAALLDAAEFCREEEVAVGLPPCWDTTSDAVAARVAVVLGAAELILLKSVDIPSDQDWEESSRIGVVDPIFPGIVATMPGLRVRSINFREWVSLEV